MITKKIMEELTFLGGILFYILLSMFFLFNSDYYFFLLLLGLIIIYFLTLVIRIFYFKSRPRKQGYRNFIEKIDASSFPSVHSARATFIFLFLFVYFLRNNVFLIFLTAILTLLVFYSRIYLKKHDMTDVIGGIMLGILSFIISFYII